MFSVAKLVWPALLPLSLCPSVLAEPLMWVAEGAGPTTGGQVEGINDREVVGAIHAVAPHPTNASVVYVGAVNGGVWKTANAMSERPSWIQMTDS